MLTCFNYHMPTCLCALMFIRLDILMITCSHARMLLCTHVLTCLACHMCTWKIIFSHTHTWMLTCLIDHMLGCSQAWMLTRLHALIITCSQAHMPFWSYATMPHVLMITCSHAHIHWYSHVSYPHTCAHTWLMIYHYAWRLKWSCNCTFLCSNALTTMLECWGNWAVRDMCTWVLQCSYAFVLMCLYSPTHMFVCSHA